MTETQEQTTEATELPAGTPIWVDLGSSDVEASKRFYSGLFGWDAFTIPDPAAGGYTMFQLNGKDVAAVGPLQNPNQPSAWNTYVRSDDAGATAQKVREAGGQVIVEPFDVMGAGSMAVFVDPTGAFFSIWQPGTHRGAGLFNQPGTLIWNELNTRDIPGAKTFYGKVFGWGAEDNTDPSGGTYTVWTNNGRQMAGAMDITNIVGPEVPAHWLCYFAVASCDASVAKAKELGATLLNGPIETPQGPFAVLSDPQGAVFAVIGVSG